ncbi:hypothetical protein AAMO2058_001351900 [Amorphochlora amoebiformis]
MTVNSGAMPYVVINLGGQMIYVLNQRLTAQNIPREKAVKVLADVAGAMFSDKFVLELFKPQELYTEKQLRNVFHELAHASIMRLNEGSMAKLHDLMSMGFKYQLMGISRPSQILNITLNHLEGIEGLLDGERETVEMVHKVRDLFKGHYGNLSRLHHANMRRLLLQYFQDWKVKISTFLRLKIQSLDGTFVIHHNGDCPGFQLPGTLTSADGAQSKLKLKNSENVKFIGEPVRTRAARKKSIETKIDLKSAQAVKVELNALAGLLRAANTDNPKKDKFTLKNMFAPSEVQDVESKNQDSKKIEPKVEVITFGGKSNKKKWSKKVKSKVNLRQEKQEEEDDLLALMDS